MVRNVGVRCALEKINRVIMFAQKHSPRLARAVFILLLLMYWALSLEDLTVLPLVYEDEPWQASTGWKLAAQGIFGSDLFEGYHRMEQRYYGFLPLHPFALALTFRAAGVGLFQARFESVACGLVILALTWSLAQRVYRDARIGLLAIFVLLFVRGFMVSALHPTGILFLDAVRVSRYDVLPPLFGLLALHCYLNAARKNLQHWYFIAGLCAALAGFAHLYGAFFFIVLLVLMMWNRPPRLLRALGVTGLGFFSPWLFYAAYVMQDMSAWRAQTRGYGERFELWNLRWYLENMRTEVSRYSVGYLHRGELFPRPGFWILISSLSASVYALLERAALQADRRARVVVTPLVLLPVLLALLVHVKFTNYLFVVAPFAAIAVGWIFVRIWEFLGASTLRVPARALLVGLLMLVFVESAFQMIRRDQVAQTTTPYPALISRLEQFVPEGSRVAGLHTYALGWEQREYRALIVPFLLANATLEESPQTLTKGLNAQKADYILLDARLRQFLQTTDASTRAEFERWMRSKHANKIAQVNDSSYGLFEIYQLNP